MLLYITMTQKEDALRLHTDGGARGNPGPAGIGYAISTEDGTIIYEGKKYIGHATNNEAEYQGLIDGLKAVNNNYPKCKSLDIFCDSQLMVKQVLGEYKIKKPHLKKLVDLIKEQLNAIDTWSLTHVKREFNKDADRLVNEALDERDQ